MFLTKKVLGKEICHWYFCFTKHPAKHPVLSLTQKVFIIFPPSCPAEGRSYKQVLAGTWYPAGVNPTTLVWNKEKYLANIVSLDSNYLVLKISYSCKLFCLKQSNIGYTTADLNAVYKQPQGSHYHHPLP